MTGPNLALVIESLQDTYGPNNICFGCGPANDKGLRIKSFVDGHFVVADFDPSPEHQAFEGAINGGIIGTLFDCHMNWTAANAIMKARELDYLPVALWQAAQGIEGKGHKAAVCVDRRWAPRCLLWPCGIHC